MAAQDLTPQLRTRLSRLEKLVGWFVTVATLLLLAGLTYYVMNLAERKGWFLTKAPYFTYLKSGAGIQVGSAVRLMGFPAGEITKVVPEAPESGENVYVEFVMYEPNYGYVWDDSIVKVHSAGFLGDRWLEVTKGGTRVKENLHATYKEGENGRLVAQWDRETQSFRAWNRGDQPYELYADEPPELGTQLDDTVAMLKESLTNILQLTNALAKTLNNAAEATETANELLRDARPLVRNITAISENLKEPRGSLGEWLFPVPMNQQITTLLTNANVTVSNVNDTVLNANTAVTNVNTNLVVVFGELERGLEGLAGITSNLNAQVQRNNNILTSISRLVVDSDDLVQGLKRHWLLRSAFKNRDERDREVPRPTNPKGGGRN